MARSGGFGGTLNPFGTGSLGGFSAYDIAADLADLEVYRVEVAWGNGTATDEEYLAALTKARDATDVNTQRRETAQNKLDDGVYRIGRSKAEDEGLDALIAFDQASLVRMNPNNVRYRDVEDSLNAELAQRRSRDYGRLVDDYNVGKAKTADLRAYVDTILRTIDEDAPDFDNWTGVRADLEERAKSERDAKMYQDFQQGRVKAPAFLTYIRGRRDSYDPGSPKYDEWTRKVEDAEKSVKDTAQAKADATFFNRYEEGKVSDAAYLKYLRTRIAGMDPDDPQLGEWKHRLNQASFSLAEDQLRFDVERGKQPVSRLIAFYKSYRTGLNPGSAEWRQITRALDNLRGYGSSGGGRGGGGGGSAKAGVGVGSAIGKGPKLGKHISPKYTLQNVLGLFTIDPTAPKKNITAATKALDLNMQSLGNAVRAGDSIWLFQDPRTPGSTVAGRYPDGSPMLDAKGKPIMVLGSAYLPASNEALSNLDSVVAGNWHAFALFSAGKGDVANYYYGLKRSSEMLDQARLADSMGRGQSWDQWYKDSSDAIQKLTNQGDYAGAIDLIGELAARLNYESSNPYLDDTRRAKLETIGEKLNASPLLGHVDPLSGAYIPGAVNTNALASGIVVLNPGWHHVLGSTASGQPDYKPVFDDRQDGSWEASHTTVRTAYGGKAVVGEVPLSEAVTTTVYVNSPSGRVVLNVPGSVQFFSYQDENGMTVRAYSLDGKAWISPGIAAPPPSIELTGNLTQTIGENGQQLITDEAGNVVLASRGSSWELVSVPDTVRYGWYGSLDRPGALMRSGESEATYRYTTEMGAPGMNMQVIQPGSDGTLDFALLPPPKPVGYGTNETRFTQEPLLERLLRVNAERPDLRAAGYGTPALVSRSDGRAPSYGGGPKPYGTDETRFATQIPLVSRSDGRAPSYSSLPPIATPSTPRGPSTTLPALVVPVVAPPRIKVAEPVKPLTQATALKLPKPKAVTPPSISRSGEKETTYKYVAPTPPPKKPAASATQGKKKKSTPAAPPKVPYIGDIPQGFR